MQPSPDSENTAAEPANPRQLLRHVDSLAWETADGARWARAFGADEGTKMLSLYAAEFASGKVHPVDPGEGEAVGYVMDGRGTVSIGRREFEVEAGDGFHVRAGEALGVESSVRQGLALLLAVCPSPAKAPWHREVRGFRPAPKALDDAYPQRVVSARNATRETAGDRWFRILVGPSIGSAAVTQFIGSIPRSKAPEHFHLYEEVICVLGGEGRLWLGDESAPLRPGSLIFLPREQPHCLECTVDEGLELLGMFYPAGSPAVNYAT